MAKIRHEEVSDKNDTIIISANYDNDYLDISLEPNNGGGANIYLTVEQVERLISTMIRWKYKQ